MYKELQKQSPLLEFQTREAMADAFMTIQSDYRSLENDKKLFGKNSQSYDNIKDAMRGILEMTAEQLSEDSVTRNMQISQGMELYQNAISKCREYMDTHTPRSIAGKRRLRMINNLYQALQRDCANLQIVAEEKNLNSWNELLGAARCHTLDISERQDLSTAGDFTSQLLVVGDKNKVFFKETDMVMNHQQEIDQFLEKTSHKKMKKILSAIKNPVMDTFDIVVCAEDALSDWISNPESFQTSPRKEIIEELIIRKNLMTQGQLRDKGIQKALPIFFGFCQMNYKSIAIEGVLEMAKIKEGLPLSSRNVATSRVVAMFGTSDTVAPSQLVLIKEKGKADRYGTAMKEAPGKKLEKFTREELADATIDAKVVRQLSDLQVMDYLCGQVDRHDGNFMLQTKNGEDGKIHFVGMTAFDNDMAFGELLPEQIQAESKRGRYNHLPALTDAEGVCLIPHVSEEIYHTVMNLDITFLRYSLQDIVSEPELLALEKRLNHLKKTFEETATIRKDFIVPKDGWTAVVCKDMAKQEGGYLSLITGSIQKAKRLLMDNSSSKKSSDSPV